MIDQPIFEGEQLDLFSKNFKANPFPTFAKMRRDIPIFPHNAPDGSTIWYVTRYDDVVDILRNDENFCKDIRHAYLESISEPASRKSKIYQRINENMLFSDPPDHTRLRALVSKAFTPRRINAMKPKVQIIADKLLDDMALRGELDLIGSYALPLPLFVICDLLGIPTIDREKVADWSQAIISPGSRNLNYSARKQKIRAFTSYLEQLFAQRRKDPQDDLISDLTRVEEEGDTLSEMELSSMVALLLVTGHETTVNLIGNGTLALLLHPEQLALLQADPSLWPSAVEELLRFDGPVETSTSRWVRHDIKMGGYWLKRGDLVRVVITSANRDENQFEHSNELKVQREENKHLAFGMGIHYCLGAPLARIEGHIALETLFRRYPQLHITKPEELVTWRSGILFRGLERLIVSLYPKII